MDKKPPKTNPEPKQEIQSWMDTILELICKEFEPCETIRGSTVRMSTVNLLRKIYGDEPPPIGANEQLYEKLTGKGFKVQATGFADDFEFVWLFKQRNTPK